MKKKLIIYLILLSSINILLLSSCSNHQPHTHKFNEEKNQDIQNNLITK
jgi:hypothetical protein